MTERDGVHPGSPPLKGPLIARLRIRALGFAARFVSLPTPIMVTGAGSYADLCRLIADNGVRRAMLVTDAVLVRLGVVEPVVRTLAELGVALDVFSDVEPDPTIDVVVKGVERFRQGGSDGVVAVGGGSVIDAAKAIVACHSNRCGPEALVGYFKVRRQGVPFFALPTTAGTGSEVTVASVISDPVTKRKLAIVDGNLVPSAIALDPSFMVGLPPAVTAATGMDALTHAIESYISTLSTPRTRAISAAATRAIMRDLVRVFDNGRDLDARRSMALAACQAGIAFTRASLGYVHAIAHQLGALYHLPHGLANAIVLPHVLEYSLDAACGRLAELARGCGVEAARTDDDALAAAFVAAIRCMNGHMGIPTTVDRLAREDIPEVARRALAEAHGTYPVPKYMNRAECEELLRRLLSPERR